MRNLIFILFLFCTQFAVMADDSISCGVKYDVSKYFYKINTCNDLNQVLSIQEYFAESDKLANEEFLDLKGRKVKRIGYSSSGDFNLRLYSYTLTSVIQTQFAKNSEVLITDKVERSLVTQKKLTDWHYEEGSLLWIDRFNPPNEKQIVSRQFLDTGLRYEFIYKANSRYGDEVSSYIIKDEQGFVIGNYRYGFDGDIFSILESQFSGEELNRRRAQFEDENRLLVAVIDSGFDIRHPSITPYLVNNPQERWGDVDLDGNGLAGDLFGWSNQTNTGRSGNINETVIIGGFKPFPLSHGSHVASIAMKGRVKSALYGFAGDVGNHDYLNTVSRIINEKDIRLVNMSWGFKELGAPQTPPPPTYDALKRLITENSNSLFFVAAGNNGWDLEGNLKDYPASYAFNNTLVIGALNAADYKWIDDRNVIPAIFKNGLGSNYGLESVDIFAPGKEVLGARLGGGMIGLSGTSMASPFAMNIAMQVREVLPHFSALEIKRLLMKSAGYVKKPLPCLSKGFIHPTRAILVAEYLKKRNSRDIENASLAVRASFADLLSDEISLSKEELQEIWESIDNSLMINRD